jgi:hypothetical protein
MLVSCCFRLTLSALAEKYLYLIDCIDLLLLLIFENTLEILSEAFFEKMKGLLISIHFSMWLWGMEYQMHKVHFGDILRTIRVNNGFDINQEEFSPFTIGLLEFL